MPGAENSKGALRRAILGEGKGRYDVKAKRGGDGHKGRECCERGRAVGLLTALIRKAASE